MLRPALRSGAAYLLPVFPDMKKRLREKRLGLTPANFRMRDLQVQFSETDVAASRQQSGVTELLLPHFANIPFERILEIRDHEELLYVEFQRRLQDLIYNASATQSEQRILGFMREVDGGVREMRRQFIEIQRHYQRKNVLLLVKLVEFGQEPLVSRRSDFRILGVGDLKILGDA